MSDFELIHRPAVGVASAPNSDRFAIKAMPEGTLIQVLGKPDGENLATRLRELAGGDANAVRTFGPGQWLLVKDQPTPHADLRALLAKLGSDAFGVDQTHGRIRIEVSGRAVTSVLGKGTAVDFEGMAIGQSAMTMMGHISVHMTRCAADRFELIALRGFAESLWDELVHSSAEYL